MLSILVWWAFLPLPSPRLSALVPFLQLKPSGATCHHHPTPVHGLKPRRRNSFNRAPIKSAVRAEAPSPCSQYYRRSPEEPGPVQVGSELGSQRTGSRLCWASHAVDAFLSPMEPGGGHRSVGGVHSVMLPSTKLCRWWLPGPWFPHLILHLCVLMDPLHSHDVGLQLRRCPHQPVQRLGHLHDRIRGCRAQWHPGTTTSHLSPGLRLRDSSGARASVAWFLMLHCRDSPPLSSPSETLLHHL